ncbi:MAG: TetR/AcrR family transcriptional regulator [Sphingomonadales bacterium]|nr:TetR/AcrR family transcriptional regulator [Sphingomonadales bacterium]
MNKGQRTAGRILDVAEAMFARSGYDATSLRDIAEAAGIQQPGLYKHFASKEELYRSVYARTLQPLIAIMEELLAVSPEPPTFHALTDRLIDHMAERPNVAKLLVRAALLSEPERDAVATEWLQRLVGYGQRINAHAGIESDPDLLALQIVSVFHLLFGYFASASLTQALTGRPADDPRLLSLHKALVAGFVGSL